MSQSIKHIIESCIREESKGQQELFNFLAPWLLSIAKQYTPQNHDAKDVLHDGFIKIFRHISSYDETKGTIESWTKKIIINTALNKLNKNKLEELINNYENYELPDLDQIYDNYGIEHIKKMVEELPDIYKQVFYLYEIEGYSHKEIAEQLNIKEATSRSQLSRSKILLKDIFMKYENNFILKTEKE